MSSSCNEDNTNRNDNGEGSSQLPEVDPDNSRAEPKSTIYSVPADQQVLPASILNWDPNQSHDDPMSPYSGDDSELFGSPPKSDDEPDEQKGEPEANQDENNQDNNNAHANNPPAPYEVIVEFVSTFRNEEGNDADHESDDNDDRNNDASRDNVPRLMIVGNQEEATHRLARNSGDTDDDDDDDNYYPVAEEGEDEDDDEYYDAEDRDEDDEDEEEEEDDEDDEDEDEDDDEDDDEEVDIEGGQRIIDALRNGTLVGALTRGALVAAMRHPNLTRVLFQDDDDADMVFLREQWSSARRRPWKDPNRFPKVPSMEGRRLMNSGYFGVPDFNERKKKPLHIRLLEKELGLGDHIERKRNRGMIAQSLLPSTRADKIFHFEEPVYSGQFSDDGNFFYVTSQDFNVRIYNTTNPYNWRLYKTVHYPFGQWTLTDASLSPDNKFLAYTSISPMVAITPTDPNNTGDPYTLDFDTGPRPWQGRRLSFGIWSVRFSGDGRELVAGTSASTIIVYDIERRAVLSHVMGHEDHVNAVCFADKDSPHIIYSGSDDAVIKVWDRRSLGDGREAGAFVGHLEGLTYIDSKGDGRYILSNGKDQSMKLWDIRMAMSTDRVTELDAFQTTRANSGFDYRSGRYDEDWWDPHPHDNSLVTFRGHKVLRTLIRCHFSPPDSSNSRYVYTGSADGKVWIYNLDGTVERKIDVEEATKGTQPVASNYRFYHLREGPGWRTCVRDASWHPHAPVMVASAWNGHSMSQGTLSLHSVNSSAGDEGEPLGVSYNSQLEKDPRYTDSKYMTEFD